MPHPVLAHPRRAPCAVWLLAAALVAGLAGCGGHQRAPARRATVTHAVARAGGPTLGARRPAPRGSAGTPAPDPVVLVTAETRNQVVSVDARTGRVLARIAQPADPENVVAGPVAIVVSAASHTVSLLAPRTLVTLARLRRFSLPHIVTVGAGARYAYVSDDAAGTVTPIDLWSATELAPISVGAQAHHMALSPDGRRLWVALGESAHTIVILDTADPRHPRIIGRIDPGFAVHDLVFSPDGREVWISAASGPNVTVVDAATRRAHFRVGVGPPPQHIAFAGPNVYLTSGYGARIERVRSSDGRVLAVAKSPYGSFELDVGGGYVVTSSLFDGHLSVYDLALRRRTTIALAPATRDVAILSPGTR